MSAAYTRLSQSTYNDWQVIADATRARRNGVADRVLGLLTSLGSVTDGFPVTQLDHALQTAARAVAADADEETVVAALCHDIGKAISVSGHGGIAAAILRPYVREDLAWVVSVHEHYQGAHYYQHIGMDPGLRTQYEQHPAHSLALQFADDWDEPAFDPTARVPGLDSYEDAVRSVFARPRRS
jgi:predicted HD phosphohydrolase